MRFLCTIYSRDCTFGASNSTRVGSVTVRGNTLREAAARAYVACVGKKRAQVMREVMQAPRAQVAEQTNVRAIAVCLRKTAGRGSACYLLDNMLEAWDIHVEPTNAPSRPSLPLPRPLGRRLRLSPPALLPLLQRPSPN